MTKQGPRKTRTVVDIHEDIEQLQATVELTHKKLSLKFASEEDLKAFQKIYAKPEQNISAERKESQSQPVPTPVLVGDFVSGAELGAFSMDPALQNSLGTSSGSVGDMVTNRHESSSSFVEQHATTMGGLPPLRTDDGDAADVRPVGSHPTTPASSSGRGSTPMSCGSTPSFAPLPFSVGGGSGSIVVLGPPPDNNNSSSSNLAMDHNRTPNRTPNRSPSRSPSQSPSGAAAAKALASLAASAPNPSSPPRSPPVSPSAAVSAAAAVAAAAALAGATPSALQSSAPAATHITVKGERFDTGDRFVFKRFLGQGVTGAVIAAVDRHADNSLVAVKKAKGVLTSVRAARDMCREVAILSHVASHENVVSLQDVIVAPGGGNDVYIVTDLLSLDLQQLLARPHRVTLQHCRFFMYQLLRGLQFLHSANIIHRDIKPSNVLVDDKCRLKLCDFSHSCCIQSAAAVAMAAEAGVAAGDTMAAAPHKSYVMARWYRAPEVLLSNGHYGPGVDCWAAGCIFAELLGCGPPLFRGNNSQEQLAAIVRVTGVPPLPSRSAWERTCLTRMKARPSIPLHSFFPPSTSPHALNLLSRLLTLDPTQRITASDALSHPLFASLHDPDDVPTSSRPFTFDVNVASMRRSEISGMLHALSPARQRQRRQRKKQQQRRQRHSASQAQSASQAHSASQAPAPSVRRHQSAHIRPPSSASAAAAQRQRHSISSSAVLRPNNRRR